MRAAIITYDEYINIPYIQKYETILNKKGISYDIVLWNRRGIEIEEQSNHFVFNKKDSQRPVKKIILLYQWRKFTLQLLKRHKYDKLIVITTVPGVLISDYLVRNYRNNYILDIRDYTYENIKLFDRISRKNQKNAALVAISSKGFRTWLDPEIKTYSIHNITNIEQEYKTEAVDIRKNPIVIGFLGGIRYFEENCKLINQIKNKQKIRLIYIGKVHPGKSLIQYCKENNIKNVAFMPAYNNNEKPELYKKITFINAIYGNDSLITTTAIPNKLYDCILYKKPIIVSKGTYLAEVVQKYSLGFSIDIDKENILTALKNYCSQFDDKKFLEGCLQLKELVAEEEAIMENLICNFIENKKNQK